MSRPDYIIHDQFDTWREAAAAGTYTPLTYEDCETAHQWAQRNGPPNSWTTEAGIGARHILKLLREREWLLWTLETERAER